MSIWNLNLFLTCNSCWLHLGYLLQKPIKPVFTAMLASTTNTNLLQILARRTRQIQPWGLQSKLPVLVLSIANLIVDELAKCYSPDLWNSVWTLISCDDFRSEVERLIASSLIEMKQVITSAAVRFACSIRLPGMWELWLLLAWSQRKTNVPQACQLEFHDTEAGDSIIYWKLNKNQSI